MSGRPGLHWPNTPADVPANRSRFLAGKFAAATILTVTPAAVASWLVSLGVLVVARIYEPAGDLAAPADVADRHLAWLQAAGVKYVQVLNEPDVEYASLAPAAFAHWWASCVGFLAPHLPGVKFGFPCPSVSGPDSYLPAALGAIGTGLVSFLAEHCYWQPARLATSPRWGWRWQRALPYRRPILICEYGCSDAGTPKSTIGAGEPPKSQQYLDYAVKLPRFVVPVGAFIGTGGDDQWDSPAAGRLGIDDSMTLAIGTGVGQRGGAVSAAQVTGFQTLIEAAADKYHLPRSVVAGLIDVESGGNPDATSPDNGTSTGGVRLGHALGLMQVLEGNFSAGESGYDPATNLEVGCRMLRAKIDTFEGRISSGLAAYFGAVDAQGNPTTATDVTGTSGVKYVELVEGAASAFVSWDAAGDPAAGTAGPLADDDFRQYAPTTRSWREVAVNLKGVADDALAAGRKLNGLAEQMKTVWGTR